MNTPQRMQFGIKRLIDILGAGAALIILSPLLAATAIAVRLTTPGPVLFRQTRIGRDGHEFEMLKFRSMFVDNDDSAHRAYASMLLTQPDAGPGTDDAIFKLDDPRVTTVGRFIRRYSIDELPQLWNVLAGSMSLVGPRPMLDWEIELLSERHLRRLDAKPGCTGLWQVSGRSTLSSLEMLDADLDYIDGWSPRRDIEILFRTPAAVLRVDGAR